MVQKALLDVVQATLEEADSLPAMGQSFYRMDVFVDKDTDEISPDIRNHDDGEQIGHTLMLRKKSNRSGSPLDTHVLLLRQKTGVRSILALASMLLFIFSSKYFFW